MQPYTPFTRFTSADPVIADTDGSIVGRKGYHWSLGDRGRFFIGIPHCDSGIFQGGLTLGKDTIELMGRRLVVSGIPKLAAIRYEAPVFITTSDRILKIRSVKPTGAPHVDITTATFDELMGGV
jgi:hypothetical protein